MKKRSLALRALTTAVVIALLGTTALPALAAQPASAEPLALASRTLTAPAVSTSADFRAANAQLSQNDLNSEIYRVNTTISAIGGVGLTFATGDNIFTSDADIPPQDIKNGGQTRFSMWQTDSEEAFGPYGFVAAQIFFNGKPTGYWAKIYVSDWTSTFKDYCEIFMGDPQLDGTLPALTPYSCKETKTDYTDSYSHVPINLTYEVAPIAATVITDPIEQKQLLDKWCTEKDENCVYQPSSISPGQSAQVKTVGSVVSNRTDFPVRDSVKIMEKYAQSDSVGGSVSTKVKVGGIWSFSAEASYEHSWTTTRSITQTIDIEIPPQHTAWFTIGWQVETITGDFIIRQGSNLYRLSNVTVTSASADKAPLIVPHNDPFLLRLRPANK